MTNINYLESYNLITFLELADVKYVFVTGGVTSSLG